MHEGDKATNEPEEAIAPASSLMQESSCAGQNEPEMGEGHEAQLILASEVPLQSFDKAASCRIS